MKVNWKKALINGVIIWVIAFIAASILIAFGLSEGYLQWIIVTVIIVIVGFKLSQKMALANTGSAISVGLLWVIVILLLDLIITARFTTMAFFNDFKIWISYAIILLIPAFSMKKATKKTDTVTPPPTENPPAGDINY